VATAIYAWLSAKQYKFSQQESICSQGIRKKSCNTVVHWSPVQPGLVMGLLSTSARKLQVKDGTASSLSLFSASI